MSVFRFQVKFISGLKMFIVCVKVLVSLVWKTFQIPRKLQLLKSMANYIVVNSIFYDKRKYIQYTKYCFKENLHIKWIKNICRKWEKEKSIFHHLLQGVIGLSCPETYSLQTSINFLLDSEDRYSFFTLSLSMSFLNWEKFSSKE